MASYDWRYQLSHRFAPTAGGELPIISSPQLMTIYFQCPNGHKLSSSDGQAGKGGTCPKCGATFRIPAGKDSAAAPAAGAAPAVAALATGDEPMFAPPVAKPAGGAPSPFDFIDGGAAPPTPVAAQSAPAAAPVTRMPPPDDVAAIDSDVRRAEPVTDAQQRQIHEQGSGKIAGPGLVVFLCPNGHRLHGPPSLVGKAGKCPHCGAKFIIPSQTDIEEDEKPADAGTPDFFFGSPRDNGAAPHPDVPRPVLDFMVADAPPGAAKPPIVHSELPPLGKLLIELWRYREQDATLEIHPLEGARIVPDAFAVRLSNSTHCVLAQQDADGSYSLTVLAWDAIARINVRGIDELPPELFE